MASANVLWTSLLIVLTLLPIHTAHKATGGTIPVEKENHWTAAKVWTSGEFYLCIGKIYNFLYIIKSVIFWDFSTLCVRPIFQNRACQLGQKSFFNSFHYYHILELLVEKCHTPFPNQINCYIFISTFVFVVTTNNF